MRRRTLPTRRTQSGFTLMMLLVIITMGSLYFTVNNLGRVAGESRRFAQTNQALEEARAALLGYAIRFRDIQLNDGADGWMYGYLPLPDLGSSRNQNISAPCVDSSGNHLEGCDASYYSDATYVTSGLPGTVVGRFPWRTLGTGPLRDGSGECLWMMVSSSHGRIHRTNPAANVPAMNSDTLGQLDIVVAPSDGSATLESLIGSSKLHDRPIAIIFAPGAVLPGQDRGMGVAIDPNATRITNSDGDDVTACGGNYRVANYLDPCLDGLNGSGTACAAPNMGGVSNHFPDSTNQATDTAASDPKAVSTRGTILFRGTDTNTLFPGPCPSGETCTTVANDVGLPLRPDELFDSVRGNYRFIADINSMLDQIAACTERQVSTWDGTGVRGWSTYMTPLLNTANEIVHPLTTKSAGRLQYCFDDATNPKGYFKNYKEQIFLVGCAVGECLSVSIDGVAKTCAAAVVYANQRASTQLRTSSLYSYSVSIEQPPAAPRTESRNVEQRNRIENYLEEPNYSAFASDAANSLSGSNSLKPISAGQAREQDIIRCVRGGSPAITTVSSPTLSAANQLSTYAPASGQLTLGKLDITTGMGYASAALFGCAWQRDATELHNGFRTYFNLSFATLGTNVGNTGFVFAAIDGEKNSASVCGASASHLGYSGSNAYTPLVAAPKIGIEFDQALNANITAATANPWRNDPPRDGSTGCNSSANNTHSAIVYWGHESNATFASEPEAASLTFSGATNDDNVHGYPRVATLSGITRKPPTNPSCDTPLVDGLPGIKFFQNMRTGSLLFHVRAEVTPTRHINTTAPENSYTTVKTKVWIEQDGGYTDIITKMKDTTRPMSQLCDTADIAACAAEMASSADIYDVKESACDSQQRCPGPTFARAANRVGDCTASGVCTTGSCYATEADGKRYCYTPECTSAGACSSGSCGGTESDNKRYCYSQLFTCGTDNNCYRPALESVRLGFTNSQYSADQQITIKDLFTTWLQ